MTSFPLESLEQMQGFFWVLMRVSIIVFLLPLFGARGIPSIWKIGLSIILAIVLMPALPPAAGYPETAAEIIIAFVSEAMFGLILAVTVRMFFTSIQMAGHFMSFQMGFSMARAIDPQAEVQDSVLTELMYILTILMFFTMDGHHIFLRALASSFQTVPPGGAAFDSSIAGVLVKISGEMFLIGVKLAAPMVIALFLSNLCLGIVARTVPQVNILMVGFPVNICIGLVFLIFTFSNMSPFMEDLFGKIGEAMMALIRLM
jgi:flagellar biosynthetic protein FliR